VATTLVVAVSALSEANGTTVSVASAPGVAFDTAVRRTGELTGRYFGGMTTSSLEIWSWVMLSLILDTNLGVRPLTICQIPGLNSWKMLIPASPPIVEPKVLNVDEADRAHYGP
jgi:hypothetical protein